MVTMATGKAGRSKYKKYNVELKTQTMVLNLPKSGRLFPAPTPVRHGRERAEYRGHVAVLVLISALSNNL